MDAIAKRRQEDITKLLDLQAEYRGVVALTRTVGTPVNVIELEIKLATVRNDRFPEERQTTSGVKIELPTRYPFEPPKISVTTPVWNPNIFPSGLICLGEKWIPTHNLALLVRRVLQILALEPEIINLASPANADAAKWYAAARRRDATLFPTARLDTLRAAPKPTIQWKTIR
jgi:ubiquitin-protein ligase